MPKIRNLRIINAQFNDGKGIYQDFFMPFDGLNATYELANGGGKSVLLMLLLQCIIPNSNLTTKRPFKDMFISGDEKRTTHVLVEWELDEGLHEHKYLLTGFCAKKKSDQDYEGGSYDVKYFNYIHLYSRINEYDIHNIPLCWWDKDEFVVRDYSKTQSMLKEKETEFDIWVIDRKREYQEKLKQFNLLESEWELIRLINKQENFLKIHFGNNYSNSRKLVESLLIDTIGECLRDKQRIRYGDAEETKESSSKMLAEALYQSREDLKRLQVELDQLKEYQQLHSEVGKLINANERLIETYRDYEETRLQAASQYKTYKKTIQERHDSFEESKGELDFLRIQHEKLKLNIERINLMKINADVNNGQNALKELEDEKISVKGTLQDLEYKSNFASATTKYLKIQELTRKNLEQEAILRNKSKEHKELFEKRNIFGKTIHLHFSRELDKTIAQYSSENDAKKLIKINIDKCQRKSAMMEFQLNDIREKIYGFEKKLEGLGKRKTELDEQYASYPRITIALFITDEIDATKNRIEELELKCNRILDDTRLLEIQLSTNNESKKRFEMQIENSELNLNRIKSEMNQFESDMSDTMKVVHARGVESINSCLSGIENEISTFYEELAECNHRQKQSKQGLKAVEEYGFALSEDFENTLIWFGDTFDFALSGAEYLKELPSEKREGALHNAPWLPKAIFLHEKDFNAIINNPARLSANVMDSSVIIANIDHLRENRKISLGDVFIPYRDPEHYIGVLDKDKTIENLKSKINTVDKEINKLSLLLETAKKDHDVLIRYIDKYLEDYASKKREEMSEHENLMKEYINELSKIRYQIKNDTEALNQSHSDLIELQEKQHISSTKLKVLEELSEVTDEIEEAQKTLDHKKSSFKEVEDSQRRIKNQLSRLDIELKEKEESVLKLRDHKRKLESDIEILAEFNVEGVDVLSEQDIEELRAEYESINTVINNVAGDLEQIKESIKKNREHIQELEEDIREKQISIEDIKAAKPQQPFSAEYLESLKNRINSFKDELKNVENIYNEAYEVQLRIKIEFETKVKAYNSKASENYLPSPNLREASQFDDELDTKSKEAYLLSNEIEQLDKLCQNKEKELEELESEYKGYDILNGNYQFGNMDIDVSSELISYIAIKVQLDEFFSKVKTNTGKFRSAKEQFIRNVDNLSVAISFKDVIRHKLQVSESLDEAKLSADSLEKYANSIISKIEMSQKQVDALKQIEEKIIDQAFGIAMMYRDYLKKFPQMSKINIDGKPYDMVRINFDQCEYSDEQAKVEMHQYIQYRIHDIETGKIKRNEIVDHLTPKNLINNVIDMKRIKVQIRKIDRNSHRFQMWDEIKASDGQENTMYIIFLVVLMSYIRDIVVDRKDKNTSKVLIIDNPFGSTSSFYLWEKIWSILEKNNVQMICSGHKISAKIQEFFPINNILTEELSASGRIKVGIKVRARDEVKERIERHERIGQLSLDVH